MWESVEDPTHKLDEKTLMVWHNHLFFFVVFVDHY